MSTYKFKYDKEEVKLHASGRWHQILEHLCPELGQALQRPGKHVSCPMHKGKNGDGFRLFPDYNTTGGGVCNTCGKQADGIAMIMWLTGWSFKETIEVVAQTIGLAPSSNNQPEKVVHTPVGIDTTEEDRKAAEKFCQSLNRTWNQTVALDHPDAEPVRLYLARRGLNTRGLPSTLRYHPALSYFDSKKERVTGKWPAMVALVQDINGKPITLHRTYLTGDGLKAPVANPKKIMMYPKIDRDLSGASIRLAPQASCMGITEGLETGLSVMQAVGQPVWVAINTTLMEAIELPAECQMAIAWADKDPKTSQGIMPGLHSAKVFVQNQWREGRQASYVIPDLGLGEDVSVDWNDVLLKVGSSGFPSLSSLKEHQKSSTG